MSGLKDAEEAKVFKRAELTKGFLGNLGGPGRVLGSIESSLALPVKVESPGLVSFPVANIVSVSSVDQHANSGLEQRGEVSNIWLHPVSSEEELEIDVHLTGLVFLVDSKGLLSVGLVEESVNVLDNVIAERVLLGVALHADIIDIAPSLLERLDHDIVAIDSGGTNREVLIYHIHTLC